MGKDKISEGYGYPYSNLHEYNLDWIIEQVKLAVRSYDKIVTDIAKNEKDIKEFKDYVTNYLKNLDVTGEVKKNIDEFVKSGKIDEIIKKLIPDLIGSTSVNFDTSKHNKNSLNYIPRKTKLPYQEQLNEDVKNKILTLAWMGWENEYWTSRVGVKGYIPQFIYKQCLLDRAVQTFGMSEAMTTKCNPLTEWFGDQYHAYFTEKYDDSWNCLGVKTVDTAIFSHYEGKDMKAEFFQYKGVTVNAGWTSCKFNYTGKDFMLIAVHMPHLTEFYDDALEKLTLFLTKNLPDNMPCIIMGDFNVDFKNTTNYYTKTIVNLMTQKKFVRTNTENVQTYLSYTYRYAFDEIFFRNQYFDKINYEVLLDIQPSYDGWMIDHAPIIAKFKMK